ncbi:MAG: M23 family metallopeptidase [Candidatus Aminicenantes bacterium]|nr:MAG: M23 family metallopeptidase [Candidatus Aminicenantes bacterium]
MAKKNLSIIIVPHNKAKSRNISLSEKAVKITMGIGIFVFLVLTVFLIDYFTMSVTRQKYRALWDESTQQKTAISQYQQTVEKLQTTIDSYENYAQKLNIMAGLKSEEVLEGEPGIGSGSSQEIGGTGPPQAMDIGNLNDISKKADRITKNLDTLTTFFEAQALQLASTPTIWPTKGYMSSPYGWRDDPFTGKRTFHHGIDIATSNGNPIYATADGTVIQARTDKIGGKTIKIKHMFGYVTVYCHMSKFLAKVGQKVKRGETIGLVGSTGKARGPHVHYEVQLNGKEKNPYYYLLEE